MQRIDILETYSFHGEILVKLKKKNSSLEENIASPIKLNVLSPLVKFQHWILWRKKMFYHFYSLKVLNHLKENLAGIILGWPFTKYPVYIFG